MKSAYRGLTHLIALLVFIQTAVIGWAAFGLVNYIQDNNENTATKANFDSLSYSGSAGWDIHGVVGEMLIPIAAIVLVIVAFASKLPGAPKWSGIILGIVVLEVLLGILSGAAPIVGLLHGPVALVLLGVAILAGHLAKNVDAPA